MKSITRYLLINASIWAIIVAFASGLLLSEIFRSSALQAFDEQLDIVLKILVGDIAGQGIEDTELKPPTIVGEPRFGLPLSGWYWTISRADNEEIILSSESLVGGTFSILPDTVTSLTDALGASAEGIGPNGERVRILQRQISFAQGNRLIVRVTGNLETLEARVSAFQARAWTIMALFGAILLTVSTFLARMALRPLNEMSEQVRKVAEGEASAIEGTYPVEIAGLVDEANLLIESNKETLERARTQVGNLAHALKTPLSVIANETRKVEDKHADLIQIQCELMKDQIQLYLERARIAARRSVIGTSTDIEPVMSRMVSAMRKIHSDKSICYESGYEPALSFRGEEQDLEELVGNLLDNACKWSAHTVSVAFELAKENQTRLPDARLSSNTHHWVTITIEDDGPGMSEDQIAIATQRGQRLDESISGSGLGLSIVEEIASLYQGKLILRRSELGGLKAVLHLPALIKQRAKGL